MLRRRAALVLVLLCALGAPPTSAVHGADVRAQALVPAPGAGPQVTADLSALPRAEAPRGGLVVDGVHRASDGERTDLRSDGADRVGIDAVSALRGGSLVADPDWFEGTSTLRVVRGGTSRPVGPCTSGPGATARGGRAWAHARFPCPESRQGPDDVRVVVRSEGEVARRVVLPAPADRNPLTSVEALRGDLVLLGRSDAPPLLLGPEGPVAVRGLDGATDLGPGRLVLGPAPGRPRRAVMVDARTSRTVWSRRGIPGDVSPDGTRATVLRQRGRVEAVGTRRGEPPVTWSFPGGRVAPPVWEDDGHVLVVVRQDGRTAVLRGGPGGEVERASAVLPARRHLVLVR